MKNWLFPLIILAVIFSFTWWNSIEMASETARWREQLQQADTLATAENWDDALEALEAGYQDWKTRQTYLHIVCEHDAVDDAEAMYHRAMAFAHTKEITEFRAEISDLRDQLRLLAEMEEWTLRNAL